MRRFFLLPVVLLSFPLFSLAAKGPSEYPLKVHILQQSWSSHNLRYNEYRATGRGNIWEGEQVRGFDFSYDCSFGLTRTARNQPYAAKWKKPELRLTILGAQIGKNDKYHECELKTTVREGVYILGQNGLSEMSQADYRVWKARQEGARQGGAVTPPAVSKLSVASTPVAGEIEIDGEFMGETPSTLELVPGEHSVAVKKNGYKVWERKLKLAAGAINLNAELEPESSK